MTVNCFEMFTGVGHGGGIFGDILFRISDCCHFRRQSAFGVVPETTER